MTVNSLLNFGLPGMVDGDGNIIKVPQLGVWQSIETAPMDGTEIIVFLSGEDKPIQVAYYYLEELSIYGKKKYKTEEWRSSFPGYSPNAFSRSPLVPKLRPSHWMPLPFIPMHEVIDNAAE